MEEYLDNMKTLRSYMNDLEEDAAKRSAEEQRQRTVIAALEADLTLVKAHAKQAEEEAEQKVETKAQVCSEMTEKQSRIAASEVECATLSQTLELLHQEIASTSAKLNEKRLFYGKTTENLTAKLQEQKEWLLSYKTGRDTNESSARMTYSKQIYNADMMNGILNSDGSLDKMEIKVCGEQAELRDLLESAQLKMEDIKAKRSALFSEIAKSKQILEQEQQLIAGFPSALQQMDLKSLEEEHKALLSDKAGEMEYFVSLKERIREIKGVSDAVKCRCGLECTVELNNEAMDAS